MHLLYFVQYFPPEKASGLPLVIDMIEGFAKRGWDVDVYIPTPTRGVTDEVRREYAKRRKEVLCDGKLKIHRMHLYREGTGMLQRTIRYCLFSIQCLIRGLFIPADVIFTGGGPPTQGLVGGIIHKLTKKKFIFNPQDLFPDSLIIAGEATEDSRVVKIGRRIEKFAYKNADVIVTITEDMAVNIRSRTEDKSKVHVVRNWIDTEKTVPIDRNINKLFDEFGLDRSKFYVVYAGNIGQLQGLEVLVDAAEILRDIKDVRFVIFGNGSEEIKLKRRIKAKGLLNIKVYPLLSLEKVSEVYSLGNVSVVSCKCGAGGSGMPSKTWTIMATGTPIIASFDLGGEMERIINDAGCGYCVPAEDAKSLAETIKHLMNKPEVLSIMSSNARRYAEEQVSKETAMPKYIEIIEKMVRGK